MERIAELYEIRFGEGPSRLGRQITTKKTLLRMAFQRLERRLRGERTKPRGVQIALWGSLQTITLLLTILQER
jgi:hypothetical protein